MAGERFDQYVGDCTELNAGVDRPYIGVFFECCGVYTRVYRRPGRMSYAGRCPNCLRTVRVRVGPDGTHSRIFRAH